MGNVTGAADLPPTGAPAGSGTTENEPTRGSMENRKIEQRNSVEIPPEVFARSSESPPSGEERSLQLRGHTEDATASRSTSILGDLRQVPPEGNRLGRALRSLFGESIARPFTEIGRDFARLVQTAGASATISRPDVIGTVIHDVAVLIGEKLDLKAFRALLQTSRGVRERFLYPAQLECRRQLLAGAEKMKTPADVKRILGDDDRGRWIQTLGDDDVAIKLLGVVADRLDLMCMFSGEASTAALERVLETLQALPDDVRQAALTAETHRPGTVWTSTLLGNLITHFGNAYRPEYNLRDSHMFSRMPISKQSLASHMVALVEQLPVSSRPNHLATFAKSAQRKGCARTWHAVLHATLRVPEDTEHRTKPMLELLNLAKFRGHVTSQLHIGTIVSAVVTLPVEQRCLPLAKLSHELTKLERRPHPFPGDQAFVSYNKRILDATAEIPAWLVAEYQDERREYIKEHPDQHGLPYLLPELV
jgi:hypothetical protein